MLNYSQSCQLEDVCVSNFVCVNQTSSYQTNCGCLYYQYYNGTYCGKRHAISFCMCFNFKLEIILNNNTIVNKTIINTPCVNATQCQEVNGYYCAANSTCQCLPNTYYNNATNICGDFQIIEN